MPNRRPTILVVVATSVVFLISACSPAASPSSTSLGIEPTESIPPESTPPQSAAAAPFDVTVNGISIHGSCSGTRPEGTPAVVLSHGIGGNYTELQVMEDHMATKTLVCGYSRAGVGESDPPAETPRPVADVVVEMAEVLAAAEVPPPYFLVGFSGGGSLAMMFAQAHPADVVGFVSINPVPPYTAWTDVARTIWSPQDFQTIELDWYAGANDESIDMTGTDSMLTGQLPSTMPYAIMFDEDCGGDEDLCSRLLDPLAEATETLAGVGDGGRFVWVEGAGHDIDLSQPQAVRDTLDVVWTEATD